MNGRAKKENAGKDLRGGGKGKKRNSNLEKKMTATEIGESKRKENPSCTYNRKEKDEKSVDLQKMISRRKENREINQ